MADSKTITFATSQRSTSATVTVSGRDAVLEPAAIAALTGNHTEQDAASDSYRWLRSAYEMAASMGGTIGYAQAFNESHIVIDLPAPPHLGRAEREQDGHRSRLAEATT